MSHFYPCVLVDLDDTVCATGHRDHLIPDWMSYSMACTGDSVIQGTLDILDAIHHSVELIGVTGRNVEAKRLTEDWLVGNGVPIERLYMRPTGNNLPSPALKHQFATEIMASGRWKVLFGIDDHPGVAKAYAELGIPTLLVPGRRLATAGPVDADAWRRW